MHCQLSGKIRFHVQIQKLGPGIQIPALPWKITSGYMAKNFFICRYFSPYEQLEFYSLGQVHREALKLMMLKHINPWANPDNSSNILVIKAIYKRFIWIFLERQLGLKGKGSIAS